MSETTVSIDPRCTDFRAEQLARWESGDRVLLESLLEPQSDLWTQSDLLLDLIYAEVLLREEYGERPTAEEYARRFPALAPAIRRQFALHEALMSMETWPAGREKSDEGPERIGPY